MSNKPQGKRQLVGKYFSTKYGYGDSHLEGWYAIQTGPKTVRIHRSNGTHRDMSEGETVSSVSGSVQFQGDRVAVGNHVVPLFDLGVDYSDNPEKIKDLNITHSDLRARPIKSSVQGKSAFILETEDGSFRQRVLEGDTIPRLGGALELTSNGQVMVNVKGKDESLQKTIVVAVHPLEFEVNLVVFNEPLNGGYRAFLNLKRPGDKSNMRNGLEGTMFPKAQHPNKGKPTPANFSVMNPDDGSLYKLCTLFETKNPKYASGIYTSLETAILQRQLHLKYEQIRSEAEELSMSQEDHPKFDSKEYARYQAISEGKEGYRQGLFVVNEGANLINQVSSAPNSRPQQGAPQRAASPSP